ncbi:hypothetical protein TNCV_2228001 [Trichonephila clavipes]|nr:hypothetical protein TNCV_2228001 [Trichonephila clavipes]
MHNCGQQWSRGRTNSRKPESIYVRVTTDRETLRIRHITVKHHSASEAESISSVGIRITQANWRVEWQCDVFSDESCLGASNGHILIRRYLWSLTHWACARSYGTGSNFL